MIKKIVKTSYMTRIGIYGASADMHFCGKIGISPEKNKNTLHCVLVLISPKTYTHNLLTC